MSVVTTVHGIVARDLRRSLRQKSRLFGGLARSFMWLLLVGTGYNAIARVEGAASYQAFVYPGIVVMAALFGAMLTAISTVYDREFGMLRLMLSCPAGTMAVLTGRALSATLVGIVQGGAVLLCAPLLLDLTAGQLATRGGRPRRGRGEQQRAGPARRRAAPIGRELRRRHQRRAVPAAVRQRRAVSDHRHAAVAARRRRG